MSRTSRSWQPRVATLPVSFAVPAAPAFSPVRLSASLLASKAKLFARLIIAAQAQFVFTVALLQPPLSTRPASPRTPSADCGAAHLAFSRARRASSFGATSGMCLSRLLISESACFLG